MPEQSDPRPISKTPRIQIDMSLVLLVGVAIAILFLLTFELWLRHGS